VSDLQPDRLRIEEVLARSDAAFDGRDWLAMPKADRQRYIERSRRAVMTAEGDGFAIADSPYVKKQIADWMIGAACEIRAQAFEECAKIADAYGPVCVGVSGVDIAAAIRARKAQEAVK
jgi:hypothetical protein